MNNSIIITRFKSTPNLYKPDKISLKSKIRVYFTKLYLTIFKGYRFNYNKFRPADKFDIEFDFKYGRQTLYVLIDTGFNGIYRPLYGFIKFKNDPRHKWLYGFFKKEYNKIDKYPENLDCFVRRKI